MGSIGLVFHKNVFFYVRTTLNQEILSSPSMDIALSKTGFHILRMVPHSEIKLSAD